MKRKDILVVVGIPLALFGVAYFLGKKGAKEKGCHNNNVGATLYGLPKCNKPEQT